MRVVEHMVVHPWRVAAIVVLGGVLGLAVFYVVQLGMTLGQVASEEFDPSSARAALGASGSESVVTFVEPDQFEPDVPGEDFTEFGGAFLDLRDVRNLDQPFLPTDLSPFSFGAPIDDGEFLAYLMVGTDASGFLADVIILALQPPGVVDPIMVSLPRDLYVWNECRNTFTRLNAGMGGCGDVASGMEMMALLVEDYTGIPVDHMARINFAGFTRVVDQLGGTTICVNYPSRDWRAELDIPAGCTRADGETTLAWVRSRHTEQYINGQWRQVVGSDFARQNRQQDVLFQLAAKASGFSSPLKLRDRLAAVASSVKLDSDWTFLRAVSTAWRYRNITKDSVSRFSIDATNYRTPAGAQVLLPDRYFADQLAEVYPGLTG